MITSFKEFKLFENPDTVLMDDGIIAKWDSSDSRPFGYVEVIEVGDMLRYYKYRSPDQKNYEKKIAMLVSKYNRTTHWDTILPDNQGRSVERKEFIYPGRLWEQKKVISFWSYPRPNEMEQVIRDIEKVSGLKIWDDTEWKIEVIFDRKGRPYNPNDFGWGNWNDPARGMHDTHIIKLRNYNGSDGFDTKVKLDISPLDKEKNVTDKLVLSLRKKLELIS